MTIIYKNQKHIALGIYLIILIMWTAVFHHVFYETEPSEIKNASKIHKDAKRIRNNSSNASFPLIRKYASNEITKEEFIMLSCELENKFLEYEKRSDILYDNVNKTKAKYSFFGFKSYNVFAFQLSARIVLLLSVILCFLSLSIKEKSKKVIRAFKIALINLLISFAFYTTWIFYEGEDLSTGVYYTYLISIAIVSGISAYYLITWFYRTLESKLKKDKEIISDTDYALKNTLEALDIVKSKIMLNYGGNESKS